MPAAVRLLWVGKMEDKIIEIHNLFKVYKTGTVETVALSGISFEVKEGEFVAIMGASGSGKSTLMQIIGLLDVPTSGKFILGGKNTSNLDDDEMAKIRNKEIGFVFQFFNLLPRRTALQNITIPMIYAGIPEGERVELAKKFLKTVGLEDRINHLTNQLSGGQQQRVAIARALVLNPAIILADEPTGNIATHQAQEIMHIFKKLNEEGHTIIMITHEPSIAKYAKRIITIRDGKIISDAKN